MLSRNVRLGKALRLSAWRKTAIGTWSTPSEASVYGFFDVDVGPALDYIEQAKLKSGTKITLTHFIGRALAEVMKRHPDINCILRFGRIYPRETVDIFFQVASDPDGNDLSGTTIRSADGKSLADIATELRAGVLDIRHKKDPGFRRMKSLMSLIPGFLIGYMIRLSGFIVYGLNLWSPILGMPKDPFGSAMVTSIGSLGVDMAFAPLVPYSHSPLIIAVGAVQRQPVVRDEKIEIASVARLCATFDHRLIDGVHASKMLKTLTKILASPSTELVS